MKTVCLLGLTLALGRSVLADEMPQNRFDPERFFRTYIGPILERRCFECHSQDHKTKGGLALDSKAGWELGGESGPAVHPGDLKGSLLVKAIRHLDEDSAMPPKEKLSVAEIALLETWVMLGAPDPRTSAPQKSHP
ncbi:MAG: c-type cytochrome domain-containing protein [Roseimicrobium sp.]